MSTINTSILRIASEEKTKAMPRRESLSVDRINRLHCPAGKDRVWIYDTRMPGLGLMKTATGAMTWYVYRKVHGRPRRIKLGKYPDLSIDNARDLAQDTNVKIARGEDPMANRRKVLDSSTLQQLWDQYEKQYAGRLSARTRGTDLSRFDTCFADWKTRPIGTITAADVRTKHNRLGEKPGQVTANRAVQLLRKLFNWAKVHPNPAIDIDLFRETERERFLLPGELPRFWKALDHKDTPVFARDFVRLALWTGARRSNVQAMRWDELDLEGCTWTIPPEKSKSREAMHLHLSEQAVQILKRRKKGNKTVWVFPGRKGGKSGHLVEIKNAWQGILKRAGIKDLHIHDLRRTLGSWQVATGASLPVIGRSLGHHDPKATAIYARLQLDPVRESVDKATEAILAAAKPEKKGAKKKAV